ncbi:uncharacterized protein SPSC_06180 [Sporisorium scitamineum]|uniref:Uncharacterized protein n=1 Tax=Sporisorium scitamineum TaxID=49012 RepID=A0A0F7RTY0_9BASI|nr:hypothetical protein [Sporisorium scitamineum]CDU26009.1 uncharacterized protein SPSC_06180 [Sporisorium scitamineum]
MTKTLLVAGSNSGHQLGVGHDEDVRTLQEALCRIDSNSQDVTSFPPAGYTLVDLSSGANHTLALLTPIQDGRDASNGIATNEVWVAGTGTQGQLGPAHASPESKPLTVFTRLDLKALLDSCADLPRSNLSEASLEPKRIVCGWNCSYIVLALSRAGRPESSEQDVLLSLGLHRENTFGELGCVLGPSSGAADMGVQKVSFSSALIEAGLDAQAGFVIVDVAAGLRHAVASLSVAAEAHGEKRLIVVGWGSARQGQVGRIPEAATKRTGPSKRPGPAAAIVREPQVIFNWKTSDPPSSRCKLRAGRDHTAVLLQGGESEAGKALHCIGSNKQGQLLEEAALREAGATLANIADVTCNWNSTHLLIEQKEGEPVILSCGSNSRGQLGNASNVSSTAGHPLASSDLSMTLQKPPLTLGAATEAVAAVTTYSLQAESTMLKKLVSGSEHSLLLVSRVAATSTGDTHQVWGWGWNEHGNLAQGLHDEADRDRPTLLLDGTRSGTAKQTDNYYQPLDVWAGFGTSFILAERLRKDHAS